jgi:chloramphenicol 3-O-phosphotransferase
MGSVLLLSGPPGAGKSAVARELVASAHGPTAWIEGDRFWSFLTKPREGTDRREHFRVIVPSMLSAARPIAKAGYSVILDFSIPPGYLTSAGLRLKGERIDYVVLRPSLAECARRVATRAEGKILDYAPYREFYALFEVAERYTIADDTADPKALAARIHQAVHDGTYRVA